MSLSRKPAALAACLALAAGGTGAGVLISTASATASTTADAGTTTSAVAGTTAGTGTGSGTGTQHDAVARTGSGTLTVTGPQGKTHTRTVKLGCRVSDGHYEVVAGGKRDRMRLTVADYTGPGNYTATAVVARHGKSGSSRHHWTVPVTITSTGGSAKYSKTLSGKRHAALKGKTISATASWTCSV